MSFILLLTIFGLASCHLTTVTHEQIVSRVPRQSYGYLPGYSPFFHVLATEPHHARRVNIIYPSQNYQNEQFTKLWKSPVRNYREMRRRSVRPATLTFTGPAIFTDQWIGNNDAFEQQAFRRLDRSRFRPLIEVPRYQG
ncbi:unnamed protein product [Caenorhabditis auriculariae]|uniref:Uncharacterized protein n=1 Tax=Caenorhabditis auriculariae TaxID=2777116 RepID=A0A8S1GST2_9PELO|nr:unnamed protein product [Caenorhabditis auriculariae]